jgi:beta-lactamase regulating signal transducer with metallopeptidase domain
MTEALHDLLGPDLAAAFAVAFAKTNLAMGAAILAVVVLRAPLRRAHGPAIAYRLWWGPLLATGLTLVAALMNGPDPLAAALSARPDLLHGALVAWSLGLLALTGVFALAQARFQVELKAGRAGPAVVGLIAPRIIFPADDGAFTAPERELIRAHEREHVGRKDPRAVAVATLLQCLCWFNPLAHLAAALLRLDQELACDAAVVLRRPGARGLYARTLLKSQMMTRPPPLACCWVAFGAHPLELRIAQLKGRGGAPLHGAVHPSGDAIRP